MGTLAASGGYYVSRPCHQMIVANPQTLTGSIGVIMEFPVLKGVMDKIGVKVEVVKSRVHKDIGSPFRDMTDQDRELLHGRRHRRLRPVCHDCQHRTDRSPRTASARSPTAG